MSKTKTKSTAKSKASKPSKRDAKGRFSPGCPGGPGRGPAQKELVYLRTLRQEVPPEDFAKLIRKLFKSAMAGSMRAAELLMKYTLPEPSHRHILDATFADANEIGGGTYRVAGCSKSENDAAMIVRATKLEERRQADSALAGRFSTPSRN